MSPSLLLIARGRRGGTVLAGYETLLGDVDKVYNNIKANSTEQIREEIYPI